MQGIPILIGVVQRVGRHHRFDSQSGHKLGCGTSAQLGAWKRQLISVSLAHQCLSPSLSPFLPPLKINKQNLLKHKKEKCMVFPLNVQFTFRILSQKSKDMPICLPDTPITAFWGHSDCLGSNPSATTTTSTSVICKNGDNNTIAITIILTEIINGGLTVRAWEERKSDSGGLRERAVRKGPWLTVSHVSNLRPAGRVQPRWLWMWPNTKSEIYLQCYEIFLWLCVAMYLMWGPRQRCCFLCGPETPKGWILLAPGMKTPLRIPTSSSTSPVRLLSAPPASPTESECWSDCSLHQGRFASPVSGHPTLPPRPPRHLSLPWPFVFPSDLSFRTSSCT